MSTILEESMEQEYIPPSSPFLFPQSEMDIFLQNKVIQDERNIIEKKINKVQQAKALIFDIIEMENSEQLKLDLLDCISKFDFLTSKIKNPDIISPKESLLNEINLKIQELSSKFNTLENKDKNKNNKPIISYNYPPSPKVVVPQFKALEDSIHRNNDFQEVQYKKKSQKNKNNNNNNISNSLRQSNIENNKNQSIQKEKNNNINLKSSTEGTESKNQYRAKLKEKRLILQVPEEFIKTFSPFAIRNEINRAFQDKEIRKPVIFSITKSKSNLSIILTTMDEFNARFLIDHKAIWEDIIPFIKHQFDEEWFKLIIHKVPTKPFICEEGLDILKKDIEQYNNIELLRTPIWLSQEEARLQKNHSSIIIHISDPKLADILIKRKISIAGEPCNIEKFIPKNTQCEKCQKYGHTKFKCKNNYACKICAGSHDSEAHFCVNCHTKKPCEHIAIKCINCELPHMANDRRCLEWQKLNPKMRFITPMDLN